MSDLEPDAAPDPFVGTMFGGRWIIERPLTSGGMGAVYVAKHQETSRQVALKVIKSESAHDRDFVARFKREAGALAAVSHPNVVTFLDSGVESGHLFLVMELLAGRSLRDDMERPIEWRRAFRICADVCRALAAVHKRGIIHRDLKPENVFLQDSEGHDEFAKLIDFGIVRLDDTSQGATMSTKTGAVVGTPGYISPEQLRGQPATAASDIYAVGVMLYEMLTGTFPFSAPNTQAMLVRQLIDPLVPPRQVNAAIPEHVENIVLKLMARDPEQRVPTAKDALSYLVAKETAELVGRAAESSAPVPVSTPRPTAPTPMQVAMPAPAPAEGVRKRGPRFAALGLVVVVGTVGFAFAMGKTANDPQDASATPPALATAVPARETPPDPTPIPLAPPALAPLPEGFIDVPRADVTLGGGKAKVPRPQQPAVVPAFAVARRQVTASDWQRFLDLRYPGVKLELDPASPIAKISHDNAQAYCQMLIAPSARLPTEDEWEHASSMFERKTLKEWTDSPLLKADGSPIAGFFIVRGGAEGVPGREAGRAADADVGFRCVIPRS